RILVGLAPADEPAVADHQIGAEDDPVPVVLETLSGVDAADLAEAALLGRPQRRRRGIAHAPITLEVPRPGPVTDGHIGHERAVLAWIRPRPAVAGGHPRRIAVIEL